ncbi:TIGR02186 family protein [Hyphomicrobium sulfonivorans]|uniref:TIGR02186 family protein n=1 Tax=Hyphomicrobium sulfonivorans TaxID=121290 RepID=UPI001FE34C94|nr:TIGR02186 family protein [Hyphomicrobium sulfonivorans]
MMRSAIIGVMACLWLALNMVQASAQEAEASPPPNLPPPTVVTPPLPPMETVEADISTRSLEVTTGFTGHEIVVFGAIDNSQAPKDDAGSYYDVVVVVEGTPFPIVARRKSEVGGVWMNTSSITFNSVPSYYAIASSKPIEEIAGPAVLERHAIGFRHIKMMPAGNSGAGLKDSQLAAFRSAVIRLKQRKDLYVLEPEGVDFVGRSLFRSTIALPANIPVGPLVARTYLFRDGEVVSAHIARVTLHRAGIERLVHNFAFVYPASYGLIAVIIAVLSGLLASVLFRRKTA